MAAGKFVSYLRVSTQRQGRSGLGLEAQRQAVATYLNGGGRWTLVEEVVEVESGKRNDRPALAKALALCRVHRATLLVAKLDRLARNVAFISALMESGVEFSAVDFPQANRLTVHVLAAVAEHEATMISERTRAALAAAKARGTKLGGLRWQVGTVARQGAVASSMVRRARAAERRADLLPVIRSIRESGAVTLRQVAAALNRQGVPAMRGDLWTAGQVRRVVG
ncbi:MAG TPA: recombinase family protein [Alloacidobacterium sp.]|nr:recombinase family protein [Alloacidobacterium sp.]